MTTVEHQEVLDIATWCDRMARLINNLSAYPGDTAHHIRRAYHLHCLAPHALKPMMSGHVEEGHLEAMLERGAFQSAVAGLVGMRYGDLDGNEARIDGNGDSIDESSEEGRSRAMLAAWAGRFRSPIAALQ